MVGAALLAVGFLIAPALAPFPTATPIGNATQRVVDAVPGPSPTFAGKIIDLCAPGDPICTGGVQDLHWHSHLQPSYIDSGLVNQAASFVAGKL